MYKLGNANQTIVKELQELSDHDMFEGYTANYLRNYIDDILDTVNNSGDNE